MCRAVDRLVHTGVVVVIAAGANGAVATDEARDEDLLDGRAQYEFAPGRVHNLRADDFVAGHGSVTGPEVAHAIAAGR